MNFVIIMTDQQSKSMVGAYGNNQANTPNIDRLADEGIKFNKAYTASPVCTPARGAIFSGLHPQVNGAWCNNTSPAKNIPLMGDIFKHYGYTAAYTGKWHLEGGGYFGNGRAEGGFESKWWYDGQCYAKDIGKERFDIYKKLQTIEKLKANGFDEVNNLWGHRVADKAIEFLEEVGNEPFVLVCSFDEPHFPYVAPAQYMEDGKQRRFVSAPNFCAPLDDKPLLQRIHNQQLGDIDWEKFKEENMTRRFGCNSFIDMEVGRVIDAIDKMHKDDTVIIYTSDHGDQLGAHGLCGKGPMMYEETCNVPFIVRMPGGQCGVECNSIVSHLDIIPTMLELSGVEVPGNFQGKSFAKPLSKQDEKVHDIVMVSFNRFAINQDGYGGFYPIRCVTDGRYKLAINLFDIDELYDLDLDPCEMFNLIDSLPHADIRNALHDSLLEEMNRIRDPFRSFSWGNRSWRNCRQMFYKGG